MNKQLLKEILIDQTSTRKAPPVFIERSIYTDIDAYRDSKHIVIITGLRRCGKSTLMEQIRNTNPERDYTINFDDDRLVQFELADFQMLYELFIEMYGSQKTFYFDEIQNIPGWERFVRRLHNEGCKIYITGSNASLLSVELGTRLTGRYVEIHLYPFSFGEYLIFSGKRDINLAALSTTDRGLLKGALNDFILKGGLPEYLEFYLPDYLTSLYESILYRDIIVRHKISNHKAVKELVYYLASNLGKTCTYNGLSKTVGISSATSVSDYCQYLEACFLCFLINRFDYSLKKQMMSPRKIYFIDPALAVKIGFRFSQDQGRLLENIVFLELKRRGYEVFYHQNTKECDFVLRRGSKIVSVIQVCVDLDSAKTREREIAGLREAMQDYGLGSGIIITLDTQEELDDIHIIPVWRWLLTTETVS